MHYITTPWPYLQTYTGSSPSLERLKLEKRQGQLEVLAKQPAWNGKPVQAFLAVA